MDQLKDVLAKLKTHQFWVLGGVALLTAMVVWYLATGELDAKFLADKTKDEAAFRLVAPIKTDTRTNSPPNPKYKESVDVKRVELGGQVKDGWSNLYARQMKVLTVHPRVGEMAPYFVDKDKVTLEIPPGLRETYHNNQVIEDDFRDLFKVLNLRRTPGVNPVDEGNVAVDPRTAPPPEGLVVWAATPSPKALMLRYKTTRTPSTVRVRMTQEDLWVFRALFGVIEAINQRPIDEWLTVLDGGKPSDSPVDQANVPIKQINFCDLAQYAMASVQDRPGKITVIENEGERPDRSGIALGGGMGGFSTGTVGTEEEDRKLMQGRYVDGRSQPVEDPNAPPFSEFKQIFVQLTVLMDQRLIPVLISEFANASPNIETRQMLVDLNDVDKIRTVDARAAANQMNKVEQSPHDAVITIRGIVYLYNPPDVENLGKGTDPEPSNRDYGVPLKPLPKPVGAF
jgi:hypothetical protein